MRGNLAAVRDKWRILLKMVMNRTVPHEFLRRHSVSWPAYNRMYVFRLTNVLLAANIQNDTRTFRCTTVTA